MSHAQLIDLASFIAISGLLVLAFSGFRGVLLASHTAQKLKFLRGQTFKYHRLLSILGTLLLVIYPIPLVIAHGTTGINLTSMFVPYAATKKVFIVAIGTLTLDILLVVLVSSLYIRNLKRKTWRLLHYGTYLMFCLGFYHALSITKDFGLNGAKSEANFFDLNKVLIEAGVLLIVLFPVWRINALRKQHRANQQQLQFSGSEGSLSLMIDLY